MFAILNERSHLQVFFYGDAKEIQRQLEILKLGHQRETGGGAVAWVTAVIIANSSCLLVDSEGRRFDAGPDTTLPGPLVRHPA